MTPDEHTPYQRARSAANRAGLIVRKGRHQQGNVHNKGGFMVVDPQTNCPVYGSDYDLTAEDVIRYCEEARMALRLVSRSGGANRARLFGKEKLRQD
jgi:hypothetical protein